MKTIALILTGAALLTAATPANQASAQKPKTQAQQRADAAEARGRQLRKSLAATQTNTHKSVVSVPPDAVQVEPNLYRHTDAQGKTWLYRRTPFGVSRWEDSPSSKTSTPSPAAKEDAPVTATDLGDKVQFERKTPFGSTKWTQKKTEPAAGEKAPAPAAQGSSPQSQKKIAEKQ